MGNTHSLEKISLGSGEGLARLLRAHTESIRALERASIAACVGEGGAEELALTLETFAAYVQSIASPLVSSWITFV